LDIFGKLSQSLTTEESENYMQKKKKAVISSKIIFHLHSN